MWLRRVGAGGREEPQKRRGETALHMMTMMTAWCTCDGKMSPQVLEIVVVLVVVVVAVMVILRVPTVATATPLVSRTMALQPRKNTARYSRPTSTSLSPMNGD